MDARLAVRVEPGGVGLNAEALVARLGGRRKHDKFLASLTVVEKPQPGRARQYARKRRTAYRRGNRAWGEEPSRVFLPRAKLAIVARLVPAPERAAAPVAGWKPTARVRRVAPERWVPARPLWANQFAIAEHVTRKGGPFDLRDPLASGAYYLEMGTGLGKTGAAIAVAARVGGPVLVVVPTKYIRGQWIDEFASAFPLLNTAAYDNPPKKSRKVPPGAATHDVVLGIINTVSKKPPEFFAPFALVIFDEAHEYGTPSRAAAYWASEAAPRRLGLSASPLLAPSGLDRVVFHHLGKPVVATADIPGYSEGDTHFLGRVREIAYAGHPDHVTTDGAESSAICTIVATTGDPARVALIVTETIRLYLLHKTASAAELAERGLGPRPAAAATAKYPAGEVRSHGIFVFSELRAYLDVIREALVAALAKIGVAADAVYAPQLDEDEAETAVDAELAVLADEAEDPTLILRGGSTRADTEQAHHTRIVLTTYGYSRRGVSITHMTAIVKATPRRSGSIQINGRVTRLGSDESIVREIVDIIDTRTMLKSQNTTRRVDYRMRGWAIFRTSARHEDFAGYLAGGPPPRLPPEKSKWVPDAPAVDDPVDDGRIRLPPPGVLFKKRL